MPNWRDKYDFVVSLCFTGNQVRVPPLDAELERVGLRPDLRIWNVPCPFEKKLLAGTAACPEMKKTGGWLNSGLGHYRAVKTAYELGAERSLVLEDDVRFLKDLGALAEIVEHAPDDGIALYDLCGIAEDVEDWKKEADALAGRSKNGWAEIDNPLSLACYGMDRKAMAWFIECCELAFSGRAILKVVDQWMTKGMRHGYDVPVRVAWPLACVQKPIAGSKSNSLAKIGVAHELYSDMGVDIAKYAV